MNKIIKTTEGEASFRLKEEFENEDKANIGKEPIDSEVTINELKIENINYKLKKELVKDGNAWCENFTFGKKA